MKIKSQKTNSYEMYKQTLQSRVKVLEHLSYQYAEQGDTEGSIRTGYKAQGIRLAMAYLREHEF
jgi:hypothetical protein